MYRIDVMSAGRGRTSGATLPHTRMFSSTSAPTRRMNWFMMSLVFGWQQVASILASLPSPTYQRPRRGKNVATTTNALHRAPLEYADNAMIISLR